MRKLVRIVVAVELPIYPQSLEKFELCWVSIRASATIRTPEKIRSGLNDSRGLLIGS